MKTILQMKRNNDAFEIVKEALSQHISVPTFSNYTNLIDKM